MSIKILMPALSPTMTVGILQKWLVKIGDQVKAGDIIAEIETDKATMELEAVDEGKITNILVKEGSKDIPVNTPIAILNGSNDNKIDSKKEYNKTLKDNTKQEKYSVLKESFQKKDIHKSELIHTSEIEKQDQEKNKLKYLKASPLAKKIAKEKKIEITNLVGSGPGGRIIKKDFKQLDSKNIENYIPDELQKIEPSNIRKIIAEKTTETKNTVPHFYLTIESVIDKLLNLRNKINFQNNDTKVSINDILIKSLALAQKMNPETNVSWLHGNIIKYSSVDVSIAVALTEGLITPVIKDADKKGLLEIAKESKNLINLAKEGKLMPEQFTGGTISISNLGMYGISEFAAIINPPQSSILAVGAIQKSLILQEKKVKEINILKSTLSADHRVLDGAIAAKLLKDFSDIIENPFDLWLQSKDMEII